MCNLQGVVDPIYGVHLSNPMLLSSQTRGEWGPTDLGPDGVAAFMAQHRCGAFCDPQWRRRCHTTTTKARFNTATTNTARVVEKDTVRGADPFMYIPEGVLIRSAAPDPTAGVAAGKSRVSSSSLLSESHWPDHVA